MVQGNCQCGGRPVYLDIKSRTRNFQNRGVLLVRLIVGQGHTALTVGAGGVVWIFFSFAIFCFLSPSLRNARCSLKYCFKGSLNPKQPINQPISIDGTLWCVTMLSYRFMQIS